MATAESVKAHIQSLINGANTKTGKGDTTLTSAVRNLINGYGTGSGGGSGDIIDVTELPTTGLVEDAIYRLTEDSVEVYLRLTPEWFGVERYVTLSLGQLMGAEYGFAANTPTHIVDELPTPSAEHCYDVSTYSVPIYIVESTVEPYLINDLAQGFISVPSLFDGTGATIVNLGWVDDEKSVTGNDNCYFCVRKSKVTLYTVENGELKSFYLNPPKITYKLSNDGTYYIASGNPNSKDNFAEILGEYNGLPVKEVDTFMCANLSALTIDNGVEIIAPWCFDGTRSLIAISLPDTLTTIEECAFVRCSALSDITIPSAVKTVGRVAFSDCTSLHTVIFKGKPTTIVENAFTNCPSLQTIYVPWSRGEVAGAPWGAPESVNIIYNYTE